MLEPQLIPTHIIVAELINADRSFKYVTPRITSNEDLLNLKDLAFDIAQHRARPGDPEYYREKLTFDLFYETALSVTDGHKPKAIKLSLIAIQWAAAQLYEETARRRREPLYPSSSEGARACNIDD
jgi:hypothetical protein